MSRQNIKNFSLGYAILRLIFMVYHRLYYRKLRVLHRERIPAKGPVIFVMNHQNALMDALAILFNTPRQIVFMARADIFRKKITAAILYFLKILPVYRIRDGFHAVDQNKEVFSEVINALEHHRPVALFPEGSHLGQRRLRPFKKGAARLAMQTLEANGFSHDVAIVPIGIYYSNYYHAGSDMLLVIGNPVSAIACKEQYLQNQPVALGILTEELYRELDKLVININNEQHYQILHEAIEIYCPVALKKKRLKSSLFNIYQVKKELAEKISPHITEKERELIDLKEIINQYNDQLKETKIRDLQILNPISNPVSLFIKSCLSLLLLPVHLSGMLLNYLPYRLPIYLARNIKDPHFISSVRFVYGLMFFIVWYLLLIIISFIIFKPFYIGLIFILLSAFAGLFSFYHYKYLQKLRADFRWMRLKTRNRKLFDELIEKRKAIIVEIEKLISM